ncbi:ArsR family transcriptional regulator [Papillibacter cinnamivorans DSM 12816]|uniref:ArsR family transcriptional regulator n=2 Tax=Papillibacter TaxID=100175 RepID=A0A1W1ZHA8_9FIRM|nr:ArsR family transcriptional regulator [Papillibacter cinnamivorans DSM 12816]
MLEDKHVYEDKAELLKAIGHPVRLCIVQRIMEKGSSNVSGIETCIPSSQSSISQHLTRLKAAGIVRGVRVGNEIHYEICNDEIVPIIKAIFESKGAVFIEGGHDDD